MIGLDVCNYIQQLLFVFNAPWYIISEGLLDVKVQIVVSNHEVVPAVFDDISVYSLLRQGVRAIGRKLAGFLHLLKQIFLPMRRTTPTFHAAGTDLVVQHWLKR